MSLPLALGQTLLYETWYPTVERLLLSNFDILPEHLYVLPNSINPPSILIFKCIHTL